MSMQRVTLPFSSFVGMKSTGPQLVACCHLPPAERYPGHPDYRPAPQAKLQIQVAPLPLNFIHSLPNPTAWVTVVPRACKTGREHWEGRYKAISPPPPMSLFL